MKKEMSFIEWMFSRVVDWLRDIWEDKVILPIVVYTFFAFFIVVISWMFYLTKNFQYLDAIFPLLLITLLSTPILFIITLLLLCYEKYKEEVNK